MGEDPGETFSQDFVPMSDMALVHELKALEHAQLVSYLENLKRDVPERFA